MNAGGWNAGWTKEGQDKNSTLRQYSQLSVQQLPQPFHTLTQTGAQLILLPRGHGLPSTSPSPLEARGQAKQWKEASFGRSTTLTHPHMATDAKQPPNASIRN